MEFCAYSETDYLILGDFEKEDNQVNLKEQARNNCPPDVFKIIFVCVRDLGSALLMKFILRFFLAVKSIGKLLKISRPIYFD